MSMNNFVIETESLTKLFDKIAAVDNLNLQVPENSIYCFLGPNGAGKTTAIRMLLGLIRPSQGKIKILGKTYDKQRESLLFDVGSLVETPSLYPHLTGFENLELIANIYGVKRKRIYETLEMVGLQDAGKKKVGKYSHGMKQRLGLALAMLHNPKLLILDEPTNGLDPYGIKEIRELIISFPRRFGMTVFLSSHLLSEVELMATHVGIINKGKLLFQGMINSLTSTKENKVRLKVDNPLLAKDLLEIQKIKIIGMEGNEIIISNVSEQELVALNKNLIQQGVGISTVTKHEDSLENIFMSLIKEK